MLSRQSTRQSSYQRYLLGLLVVILALNFVDRLALGLVLQAIKADLRLSDTQLGFLSGIAFSVSYSVMGIPIARWADSGNRVRIIAVTTALWSVAVALCATAGNFIQLLLIRIGVAVGEAGCVPPANSLIADHFDRADRPRALARYMLGGPLSIFIGYFIAGWLNQFYGWRAMFVILGLPGVVVAILAHVTLKEPRLTSPQPPSDATTRGPGSETGRSAPFDRPSLRVVCGTLWRTRTFRHLLFFFSLSAFFGIGVGQWQAAFFIRSYGLHTGELGTWFSVIFGVGGLIGTLLGGEWATRYAGDDERLQLRGMAVAFSAFGVLSPFIYLSPNLYVAFALMGLAAVGTFATSGPLFATLQTLVPPSMRAFAVATLYLFANLIGMGLGPLAIGALSDALRVHAGEDPLRYALLIVSPGYLWGAWHLWRGGETVMADLISTVRLPDTTAAS